MATKRQVREAWNDGYEAGVLAVTLARRQNGVTQVDVISATFKRTARLLRNGGLSASDLGVEPLECEVAA
jgi:hypothetical protein